MYKLYAEQMNLSNYISVDMRFFRHFEIQKYVYDSMFHQK